MAKNTPVFVWALAAFLFGVSCFGIYQCVVLLKEKNSLQKSFNELEDKYTVTVATLQQTRQELEQSYGRIAELEGQAVSLKTQLAVSRKEAAVYRQRSAFLSEKVNQAMRLNDELAQESQQGIQQILRLSFENEEMKKKLSSLDGLKKAIRDLKKQMRQRKQVGKKPPQKRAAPLAEPARRILLKPPEIPQDKLTTAGNEGFVIRDGKSTLENLVNIEVVPVDIKEP